MSRSILAVKCGIVLGLWLSLIALAQWSKIVVPAAVAADTSTQTAQADKPFDQEQALADLRKRIAGQENKPAEEVFKNIQFLKGMPAARLLRVMELGYSKSLGVNCTQCHVAGQWEKDDKPTKPIAREMMSMTRAINEEYLKKIKNLKSEMPVVNCTTCHRGQIKPALNLPEVKSQP